MSAAANMMNFLEHRAENIPWGKEWLILKAQLLRWKSEATVCVMNGEPVEHFNLHLRGWSIDKDPQLIDNPYSLFRPADPAKRTTIIHD